MRLFVLPLLAVLAVAAPVPTVLAQTSTAASPPQELDPCVIPLPHGTDDSARQLVRAACEEHRRWFQPTIDRDGRLAHLQVTEAENSKLADDGLRAWERVASYWRESGLLPRNGNHPGASACDTPGDFSANAACRAFLVDTPWSATFISWLMQRAGVADFPRNSAHVPYIAAAHQGTGPYRTADPWKTRIRPGDLICHLRRRSEAIGYDGFRKALENGQTTGWLSHCDVVVASNPGGNRTLYAIGGNVLNTVTLRLMPVDAQGALALPPHDPSPCSPSHLRACHFNQRDWAILLQLKDGPSPAANH